MRALAVVLLMALPAQAQDILFSADATETCLAKAATFAEKSTCFGASAEQCMSSFEGGFTTVGMGSCLQREFEYWDTRLNAAYSDGMDTAKQRDAEAAGFGYTVMSVADSLRDMQRAWIPYRDAACGFERSQWGGGTGGGPATVSCMLHETARQTLLIETTGRAR